MPTYTFFNKQSGIEYDETMSMSEYDKYMENNPNIERVFQPVALGGDNMMGIGPKTDSGFNDILGRIADNNPVSPMADKFGTSKTSAHRRVKDTFSKTTKKYYNKMKNLNK